MTRAVALVAALFVGSAAAQPCVRGAAPVPVMSGPRASTASSSTRPTPYGLPATATRTRKCSSSRSTESSCCRSAAAGNPRAATTRRISAARPISASTWRLARSMSPTGIATARRRLRFRNGRLQAPLGCVRRAAERRADAGVLRRRAAVAAVRQSRALRAADARWARLRLRPREQPRADLPQGRNVRLRGFFERDTLISGSVSELAFSPDAAQRFIYMVDGVNNELRIVERATNTVLARVGRPGRYARQSRRAQRRRRFARQRLHDRGQHGATRPKVPAPRRPRLSALGRRKRGEALRSRRLPS